MFYKRLVTILAVALCLFATGAPLSTATAQANGANVYYIKKSDRTKIHSVALSYLVVP